MRKSVLYFLLLFSTICFSQTMTEKWNSYKNRYEYFNSYGTMTAYKVYNSYLKQWETFTVTNSENQNTFNTGLAMTVLEKRQNAYNEGKQLIDNKINEMYAEISATFSNEHGEVGYFRNAYYNKVVLVVLKKNLDFSIKNNVDWALKFLKDNYDWALQSAIDDLGKK